jgi:protein-disulfide isomerase
MKRYLPFVIIATVAVLTVGAGALLYHAKQRATPDRGITKPSTGNSAAEPMHVRGDPRALVTLEEFGDFQCPPCATLSDIIEKLEHDYGPRLRVIFRHFPLAMHAHALQAACAAEAAGLQGHFWEMHDLLYEYQPVWSKASDVQPLFDAYAGTLRLDVERFRKDSKSDEVKVSVVSDGQLGVSRGVKNTPTLFINGLQVRGAFNLEALHAAIDRAIAENKSS